MNYLRLLYLATTTVGLGGCLLATCNNKVTTNYIKVNAQPAPQDKCNRRPRKKKQDTADNNIPSLPSTSKQSNVKHWEIVEQKDDQLEPGQIPKFVIRLKQDPNQDPNQGPKPGPKRGKRKRATDQDELPEAKRIQGPFEYVNEFPMIEQFYPSEEPEYPIEMKWDDPDLEALSGSQNILLSEAKIKKEEREKQQREECIRRKRKRVPKRRFLKIPIQSLQHSNYLMASAHHKITEENKIKSEQDALLKRSSSPIKRDSYTPPLTWLPRENGGPIFPYPKFNRRRIIEYKDFVVCYDNVTRTACWTLEMIKPSDARLDHERFFPSWNRMDKRVPKEFRVRGADYSAEKERYKAQHVADFSLHTDDLSDPCVCTNVVPQRVDGESHNIKTIWDELHRYVVHLTSQYYRIFILSGPLYIPNRRYDGKLVTHCDVIVEKKIPVPTHFFKVILCENNDGTVRLECYTFENALTAFMDLNQYFVRRKDLEKYTGFLIFDKIKDEQIKFSTTDPEFKKCPYDSGEKPTAYDQQRNEEMIQAALNECIFEDSPFK